MNFFKKNFYKMILLTYVLVVPLFTLFADGENVQGRIANPINAQTIQEFIKTFLEGILKIGIPIVALAVIYCGFLFVQARGKPEAITKAKDALLYTLIGAAILLGSWAIAQMISNTVLAL